jgi:hypothetical protein
VQCASICKRAPDVLTNLRQTHFPCGLALRFYQGLLQLGHTAGLLSARLGVSPCSPSRNLLTTSAVWLVIAPWVQLLAACRTSYERHSMILHAAHATKHIGIMTALEDSEALLECECFLD